MIEGSAPQGLSQRIPMPWASLTRKQQLCGELPEFLNASFEAAFDLILPHLS